MDYVARRFLTWVGRGNSSPLLSDSTTGRSLTKSMERDRAILLVPELESHMWLDQYFDDSKHEIIAVFDHGVDLFDREKKRQLKSSVTLVAVLSVVSLVLYLTTIEDASTDVSGTYTGYAGYTLGLALGMLIARIASILEANVPHTAITSAGMILHVNTTGWLYNIPICDVTAMSDPVVGMQDGKIVLKLNQSPGFYQNPRPFYSIRHSSFRYFFMDFPKDSVLLHSLISAVKKQRDEDLEMVKPVDSIADTCKIFCRLMCLFFRIQMGWHPQYPRHEMHSSL